MLAHSTARFTRRQALAALALLPAEYAFAASPQPPASPVQEPPPPTSVAPAIDESRKLLAVKKFTEAIVVLEARQKALGANLNESEKRALLVAIADTYFFWGRDASGRYQHQEAIEHYQSAYVIDNEYRPKDAAADLSNIGLVYADLGEKGKALDFYNQVLPLERQVGEKSGEATTLSNIGLVYADLGEKGKALDFYNQALPLRRQVGDKRGEATTLSNIGGVYSSLGEESKALDFYNQALPLFRLVGDKGGEATTLSNIGGAYADLGETAKALGFYTQSLPLRRQVGDKRGEATTLNNIGGVYSSLGEESKALDLYNRAMPLLRQVGDKAGKATTLSNIGLVYADLGEKGKALDFYNQALPLRRQVGDKSGEATTLSNIGRVYADLGEKGKALDFYNQALPLRRQVGDKRGEATTLSNIGGVYSSLGEESKALDFYNQALPLFRLVGDKGGEATTLNNIGGAYADLGEKGKALDFYNQALPLRRQVGDKSGEANTAWNLMHLFAGAAPPLGNTGLAVTFGKQSVNLYQTLRGNIQTLDKSLQATYTKKVEPTYRELADILIGLGRLPEAQQVLGLLKEQEFSDFIRRGAKLSEGTPLADLTPREAEAKKRYDTAGDKITALAAEFETLRRANTLEPTDDKKRRLAEIDARLRAAQTEFLRVLAAITTEFQTAKREDSLDKLKSVQATRNLTATLGTLSEQTGRNTIAIYTLVAPERLHCLIVTPKAQIARSTPIKDTDLNKLVADFRIALEHPNLDPRPLGKKLYDLIVAPIEDDLKGANAKSILWSLDGTLRYLPLAALSPDGKTYLVERDTQSSLFTPATLLNLKDENQKSWNAVAFGVTRGRMEEGLSFDALPGVGEEIKAVGETVPTRVLLDEAFTDASLHEALWSKPPLVHIASHFAFRPSNPTGSFLLLGKGTLTLDTITKKEVSLFGGVDLLTLSACDTATGGKSNENGGEVESFALLAQEQGAGAVLASLWPVNDTSTQALMQTFYALHKANPTLGKAECLRQTQVALLRGKVKPTLTRRSPDIAPPPASAGFVAFIPDPNAPCAHPFYWAAFTLIGNTK